MGAFLWWRDGSGEACKNGLTNALIHDSISLMKTTMPAKLKPHTTPEQFHSLLALQLAIVTRSIIRLAMRSCKAGEGKFILTKKRCAMHRHMTVKYREAVIDSWVGGVEWELFSRVAGASWVWSRL